YATRMARTGSRLVRGRAVGRSGVGAGRCPDSGPPRVRALSQALRSPARSADGVVRGAHGFHVTRRARAARARRLHAVPRWPAAGPARDGARAPAAGVADHSPVSGGLSGPVPEVWCRSVAGAVQLQPLTAAAT